LQNVLPSELYTLLVTIAVIWQNINNLYNRIFLDNW